MRIRKRQTPLPLSSLSPIPLSDPNLINRLPVVQQHSHELTTQPNGSRPVENLSPQEDFKSTHVHLPPPDQPNRSLSPIGSWVRSDPGGAHEEEEEEEKKKKHRLELMIEREGLKEDKGRGDEEEKSNDTRKGSILGAEMGTEVLPLSSRSSYQVMVVGWGEGEKAFPLKKRRGSFERRGNEETIVQEKEKEKEKKPAVMTKMKTKMNKKCVQQNDNDQQEEDKETKEVFDKNSAKKRARSGGAVLMEGSRCSRVNGRGWRCCQQTLVGYSLCEHHLGKGRLRSMTSVRNRAAMAAKENTKLLSTSSSSGSIVEKKQKDVLLNDGGGGDDDDDDDNDIEEEKEPLMITKKRMKLGMVKARSLSSLLGQTSNTVADLQ